MQMSLLSLMTLLWLLCRVSIRHAVSLGVLRVLPKVLTFLLTYFSLLMHLLINHRTYTHPETQHTSGID